jgi:uncharacterized protein YgbK (DUF1537 family)
MGARGGRRSGRPGPSYIYVSVGSRSAELVRRALRGARRVVVLDDDPTGTQTVRDLPVLTRWTEDDIGWALRQDAPGFFVVTNTRSLGPAQAAAWVREVVSACQAVAERERVRLAFASRGDSTLRGHYPLETDAIAELVPVDAVLLCPAYVDAGRVTIGGVHYVRTSGDLLPVAESEFARDPVFGYRSSRLADWVEEKTRGRIRAGDVLELTLDALRGADAHTDAETDTDALRDRLAEARDGRVVAVDAVDDDGLRAVVLGVLAAEAAGSRFVYRVGPSFVRARVGQEAPPPLDDALLAALVRPGGHGLVVVGSHVGQTNRQLARLAERRRFVGVELDARKVVIDTASADDVEATDHIRALAASAIAALGDSLVVLSTSRTPVTGADETTSLDIARRVSVALTQVVGEIVAARRPSFVVAKGGITSADLATKALGIDRAWVRGSLLPGIVSLWQAASGPPPRPTSTSACGPTWTACARCLSTSGGTTRRRSSSSPARWRCSAATRRSGRSAPWTTTRCRVRSPATASRSSSASSWSPTTPARASSAAGRCG